MFPDMKKPMFTISLLIVGQLGSQAQAARPILSPEAEAKVAPFVLKSLEDTNAIPIIIKMKAQADLKSIESAALSLAERQKRVVDALRVVAVTGQKDIVKFLDSKQAKYRRFYISNMIAVWNADGNFVKEISSRDDVGHVYGNPSVALKLPTNEPKFSPRSSFSFKNATGVGDNISYMGADKVWEKYGKQGEGIVVAGQDSGVQFDHPALAKQYRGYQLDGASHDFNWHDSIHKDTPLASNRCGYDLQVPCDDGDHGSHTMGTMIGSDGAENKIGMAPKAKWIACRNMDGGTGSPASYIECFEWLLAPYRANANPMTDGDPTKAPNIINNSWGCPVSEGCSSDEIEPSLAAMRAAGVLVVVSAGNDGPGCGTIIDPPAWHTALTFGVGAYDHREKKIAYFSSRGPSKIDGQIGPAIVAPGVDIRSSITGGRYAQFGWSGTSMAGPHVAGAAALLWSVRPELIGDIAKTTEILRNSAVATTSSETCGGISGSAIPNNTFGMGILDVTRAIELAASREHVKKP